MKNALLSKERIFEFFLITCMIVFLPETILCADLTNDEIAHIQNMEELGEEIINVQDEIAQIDIEIENKKGKLEDLNKELAGEPFSSAVEHIEGFEEKLVDNILNPTQPAISLEGYVIGSVGNAAWQEFAETIEGEPTVSQIARMRNEIDLLEAERESLVNQQVQLINVADYMERSRNAAPGTEYTQIEDPMGSGYINIPLYLQDDDNPNIQYLNPLYVQSLEREQQQESSFGGRIWSGIVTVFGWFGIDISNRDPVFIHPSRAVDLALAGEAVAYQFSPASSPGVRDEVDISFTVPFQGYVTILIYNGSGGIERVVYDDELMGIGNHTFTWDGKDDYDSPLPEGEYRYVMTAYDALNPNRVHSEEGEILIDNTPPMLNITSVAGDSPGPGKTRFMGTVSDDNLQNYIITCTTSEMEPYIYEGNVEDDILGTIYSYTLPNGNQEFSITASDLAGNTTTRNASVQYLDQNTLKVVDLIIANPTISSTPSPERGLIEEAVIFYVLSHRANITIIVEDSAGTPIKTLYNTTQDPGMRMVVWAGENDQGDYVKPGEYTVKIRSAGETLAQDTVTVIENVSKITQPPHDSLVRAYIPIIGTATCENFSHYTLEFGPGEEPTEWLTVKEGSEPIIDSILGHWDTGFEHEPYCELDLGYPSEGLIATHTLKLTVYDTSGETYEDTVTVRVGRVLSNEEEGVGVKAFISNFVKQIEEVKCISRRVLGLKKAGKISLALSLIEVYNIIEA